MDDGAAAAPEAEKRRCVQLLDTVKVAVTPKVAVAPTECTMHKVDNAVDVAPAKKTLSNLQQRVNKAPATLECVRIAGCNVESRGPPPCLCDENVAVPSAKFRAEKEPHLDKMTVEDVWHFKLLVHAMHCEHAKRKRLPERLAAVTGKDVEELGL